MSDGVFLVLDFNAVCRLCLSSRTHLLTDIFQAEDTQYENVPPLVDQIARLTGIQISDEDRLPQQICYKCRHLVELCYELCDSADKAHQLLVEASAGMTILQEQHKIEVPRWPKSDETFVENTVASILDEEFIHADDIFIDRVLETTKIEKLESTTHEEENIENTDISETQIKLEKPEDSLKTAPTKGKHLCEICLTNFPTKENMISHVREHYSNSILTPYVDLQRPYSCEQCREKVKNKKCLVEHHFTHLELNPFKCKHSGCNFVGKSKNSLRHHSYKHGPARLVCETCGAAFRRSFELGQHRIRHADRASTFPCRRCGVVCRNRITYKAHLLTHDRKRRYKCERPGCPKAFFNRLDLEAHTRAHNNERTYACHLCVATYTTRSQLNRHIRQHAIRRVNKCDKCKEKFDNYAAFCNHRLSTHGAWQPYRCIGCNQGYQIESRLEKHVARCRQTQHVRSLVAADAGVRKHQECERRDLLSAEECMETLESLLLPDAKTGAVRADPGGEKKHVEAMLPADSLLYADGLDLEP